jgi:hypothetical protein
MAVDLDQFTDKAQATVQAAIQLAKDYANSQGASFCSRSESALIPGAHLHLYTRSIPRTLWFRTLERRRR